MKIVVICWLHTGDPDVQESQACPQTQYHWSYRPCGPMTWKHGLHKLKHSSHYGTLPWNNQIPPCCLRTLSWRGIQGVLHPPKSTRPQSLHSSEETTHLQVPAHRTWASGSHFQHTCIRRREVIPDHGQNAAPARWLWRRHPLPLPFHKHPAHVREEHTSFVDDDWPSAAGTRSWPHLPEWSTR